MPIEQINFVCAHIFLILKEMIEKITVHKLRCFNDNVLSRIEYAITENRLIAYFKTDKIRLIDLPT